MPPGAKRPLSLKPRPQPKQPTKPPSQAPPVEKVAESTNHGVSKYEQDSLIHLSRIAYRLDSIRLLLWWLGVWLPLIGFAMYVFVVALANRQSIY